MDSLACTWENRRESSEAMYSYVATCFAAFAAYGHLERSLLGNRNSVDIACRLLIFYLCPSVPLVDLVILRLLPALATWLGFSKAERIEYHSSRSPGSEPYVTGTTRSLRFGIAHMAGMHAAKTEEEHGSVPLASSHRYRFQLLQREKSKSVRIGQALVLGFLTMQCSGAVIKGLRRLARGSGLHGGNPSHAPAVVLADTESLWFALSGLSVLICSWLSFAQNTEWVLLDSVEPTDGRRVIAINTVALLFLCSLFSMSGYMDFYYDEPFWHVGFFHFLMPVPYMIGNAVLESSWAVQRRLLVTRVTPTLISLGVPILVSAVLFRPRNRALIATFWTLGFLALLPPALSPILEIFWDLELLGNRDPSQNNWGLTKYVFYHFQIMFPLKADQKWIPRAVAALLGAGVVAATRTKFSPVLANRNKFYQFWFYPLLWYVFTTALLLVFATASNSVRSVRSLRNVGTDWPCPQLWQDPLFIPSL